MKQGLNFLLIIMLPMLAWAQSATGCVRGNCENGFGEYVYLSGDSYMGYWNEGVRYGGGTYSYHDGSRFVGSYANDMRHGKGTYTSADGKKLSGRWAKGKFILERADSRSYVKSPLNKMLMPGEDFLVVDAKASSAKIIDPDEKEALEAEGMKLLQACTGYATEAIKAFTYLYSLPGQGAEDLYFRFAAHPTASEGDAAEAPELTLKFKKYSNGAYEPAIDTGRYYWDNCEALS